MTVGVMALAVPLSSNFAGEFLILAGVFQQNWVWAAIGAVAIVLAAMYMLRLISAVLHREVGAAVSDAALDLRRGELTIVLPLVALLIGLSAWPAAISARVLPAGSVVSPAAIAADAVALVGPGSLASVPSRCVAAVEVFSGPPSGEVRAESERHPLGGWVLSLPARAGSVACPGGGRVEVTLGARRVSLPRVAAVSAPNGTYFQMLRISGAARYHYLSGGTR
jgi:NADH:ubiquinone oxidoreductase subunit 5 (subunit L)/multisubunit Na+/H+ antiporter MnhA subunit